MLWIRGVPFHPGGLFDLTLRDLMDLDRLLAVSPGATLAHWWEVPEAEEDLFSMDAALRPHHPAVAIVHAVWALGSHRATGLSTTLDEVLDSGVGMGDFWVDKPDDVEPERLPRGFRSSVQSTVPDVQGTDLRRDVARYTLPAMEMFGVTDPWRLSLAVWLGVVASIERRADHHG